MRRRTPQVALTSLVSAALIAACGGSGSLQDAGNTTTVPTTSPTTQPGDTTTTQAPATTVATPLDDLPGCPVDALSTAAAPVEITFWHGMTADLEAALTRVTDAYNTSQSQVRVVLQNQGGYEDVLDKYLQSGANSRPDMVQAPEYAVQVLRDAQSFVPVEACMVAAGYDASSLLPTTLEAYSTEGVQWAMPFNVSNPLLYVNKVAFAAAGLDPNNPPSSLEELKAAAQAIVQSGAAAFGLAIDTNFDSGGGWFIEQWFAKAGEFYADQNNGRSAPATAVNFDNATGVELYTFLQELVADGWAVNVGDNASGQDTFLKMADPVQRAAMTIGTSAALGTVLAALGGGLAPGLGPDDVTVSHMPGPGGSEAVLLGGASLWIVADRGDVKTAAVWDYVSYLVSAAVQADWAATTGYVPVHVEAPSLEPLAARYNNDPRFRVAYDTLLNTPNEPWNVGPLLGPQREIRTLTSQALAAVLQGADVSSTLANAARQANGLLANYAALQGR
jgi:sn-glycerol 3-phosphate transport system substrate-binding protein